MKITKVIYSECWIAYFKGNPNMSTQFEPFVKILSEREYYDPVDACEYAEKLKMGDAGIDPAGLLHYYQVKVIFGEDYLLFKKNNIADADRRYRKVENCI